MNQNIYDNEVFSSEYDKMRNEQKGYNANDLIEIPNFRKLVPDVKNKRILDLGCGYGENEIYYKQKGASYLKGIDLSKHMIDLANKTNKSDNIDYEVMAMEDISQIKEKYDIVLSSLAFHYVENFDKLIKDIYNLLDDNGYLIFSMENPLATCVITTPYVDDNKIISNGKRYYLLSDYNRNGKRIIEWNNENVVKYHRNFSNIVNTLVKNGFIIDELLEPDPSKEAIEKVPKYIYQYDKPYFLFVKAHK